MSESHKAAIRDFFTAIDRSQNMEAIDQLAAATYTAHFPGAPPMNREAIKGYGNGFFAACPGLKHSVDALIAEGDCAAATLTIRGTHTRPFATPMGAIPPSGKSFVMPVINFYRFKDGLVIEHHSAFDMLSFLQQIGAMPGGQPGS